MGTNYLAGPAV